MIINILTLFPKMFNGPFEESIINRAKLKGLLKIYIHDLRTWGSGERRTVDDRPYGGGAGMVLMVEPVYKALKEIKSGIGKNETTKTILLTPQGIPYVQTKAEEFSKLDRLILIAGHYEGFDERIREHLIDEEVSIGDYVLTGGELPTMVIVDSVIRLIPGVLQKQESTDFESFQPVDIGQQNLPLLEYPQYTRPHNFKGWGVPEVLVSGNHGEIEKWRKEQALAKTKSKRPDLLDR